MFIQKDSKIKRSIFEIVLVKFLLHPKSDSKSYQKIGCLPTVSSKLSFISTVKIPLIPHQNYLLSNFKIKKIHFILIESKNKFSAPESWQNGKKVLPLH